MLDDQLQDLTEYPSPAQFGLIARDQLDLRVSRVFLVLVGRCGLVLQRLGIQRHGGAGHAGTHLADVIEVLKRQQRLFADVGNGQRGRGSRSLLVIDRRAESRRAQSFRIDNGALFGRRHRIIVPIGIVEELAGQNRLDPLQVLGVVKDGAGFPLMRDGLAGDVRERNVVLPDFPIQKLTRTRAAGIKGPDRLGNAVTVHVHLDVALVQLNQHHRLVADHVGQHSIVVSGYVLLPRGREAIDRKVLNQLPVKAHLDQVGTGHVLRMRQEPCILDAGGLPVQQQFLDALDLQPAIAKDALDLDVKGLDRHFHELAGRGRRKHHLGLAVLLGDDLDILIRLKDRNLLLGQAGMLGVFTLLFLVPPMLDDAIGEKERVVRGVPQGAISLVVTHENEVHVVRGLLRKRLVAGLLCLVYGHSIGGREYPDDAGQHPADGVGNVAGNDLGAPFHGRSVGHDATVIFEGARLLLGQFGAIVADGRRDFTGEERL